MTTSWIGQFESDERKGQALSPLSWLESLLDERWKISILAVALPKTMPKNRRAKSFDFKRNLLGCLSLGR
jgi:hypothetical protein